MEATTMNILRSVPAPEGPAPTGLVARLGSWSAQHRKKAILGWLALVLVATGSYGIGQKKLTVTDMANGDSAAAQRLLEEGDFKRPAQEEVLVQTLDGGSVRSAAGREATRDVVAAIQATGRVTGVRSPFVAGNAGQIAEDRQSALVLFAMKGDPDTAKERVEPVVEAVSRVAAAHPTLRVEQFGAASASKALEDTLGKDFKRAEASSIPLTLIILWLAFAAFVAALLPLILALTAIMIATGLVTLTSHALPVDGSANSMILLIGLAVGVDYSLFYFRRNREERARGASNPRAIAIAAATSGKAVLTSGLTVIVAMSAMFITGQGTFIGMAQATAIVVAVAILGSLTVLPALLSKLGDGVDRGRIPYLGRRLERRRSEGESRVWAAVVRPALAHPLLVSVATTGVLLAIALPALRLETAVPGANDLPHNLAVMKTYDRIQDAFPGGPQPAQVVVSARNVDTPAVRSAIAALERRALATGQMHEPITVNVNPKRTVARIDVPLAGDGIDEQSQHALQTLRQRIVPDTVGNVGTAHVTGATAFSADFNDQLKNRQPFVFAFVLVLAFLLLMLAFRSLVIPATAIALNLLSVGAAYGVLVAVFQWGWGGSLIGLHQHGPIAAWLPLFLFVILFGLSMDYHVFILSRIREGYDAGLGTHEAIRRGITHSAGVITSAAIVMVGVFATFATLSVVSSKQMGVGLAVAILLDATIVRGLLVPAVMALLGEHNWYLPRWLDTLLGGRVATVRELAVETVSVPARAASTGSRR
jgi:putative drug exporter of the RND superfamily